MKYNFSTDTMSHNSKEYPLKPYRKWLINNHEQLVTGHFIKALTVGDKTKFTYDWQSIYFKAEEYQFLHAYLKELQ